MPQSPKTITPSEDNIRSKKMPHSPNTVPLTKHLHLLTK